MPLPTQPFSRSTPNTQNNDQAPQSNQQRFGAFGTTDEEKTAELCQNDRFTNVFCIQ